MEYTGFMMAKMSIKECLYLMNIIMFIMILPAQFYLTEKVLS